MICAKTPQAKGRVERANRTLQDRLVKELRLRNISTVVEANTYFEEYRLEHNAQFTRPPANPADAHLPKPNEGLEKLLTYTVQRKVFQDLSLSFNKMKLILEDSELARKAIGKLVEVAMSLDGDLEVTFDETPLPFKIFDKIRRIDDHSPEVVDHKRLGAALAVAKTVCEVEPHHFQRNSHIMAGFRNHFRQPEDPRSRTLREAPEDIRVKHNGRARAPLGSHPIIILKERLTTLAEHYEQSGQKLKSETRRARPKTGSA